jgi:hypothetical protein
MRVLLHTRDHESSRLSATEQFSSYFVKQHSQRNKRSRAVISIEWDVEGYDRVMHPITLNGELRKTIKNLIQENLPLH